jgi:hypothetical protein
MCMGAIVIYGCLLNYTRSDQFRESKMGDSTKNAKKSLDRRSFMRSGLLAGGAATIGAGMLANGTSAHAQDRDGDRTLGAGDVAILRFLAAAELIEADLWTQYAELGGIGNNQPVEIDPNQSLNAYQSALSNLDSDGPQYITSNTLDEASHAAFLNAYLESKGAEPVNFDQFRTLQGSTATGAENIGRLTNLMHLNVDTSWYTRYRSAQNPDSGATFPQAITINNRTAIPITDADFNNPNHIQVIANIAAFHFGYIEQGGSSLYAAMNQKASHPDVVKITLGIGGDEVAHFLEWVDFAGNGVQAPVAPVSDAGLTFPDFFANPPLQPPALVQPSLIFPVPCEFISPKLPPVSIIRPLSDQFGGAVATIASFTADGLFFGQSKQFLSELNTLAVAADNARRS